MDAIIVHRNIIRDSGKYVAYDVTGNLPMDDNDIFIAISTSCSCKPGWHHVSFVQYRDYTEMPDIMVSDDDLPTVIRFYAESVYRMADEYAESKEWEQQMQDKADTRIVLGE